MFHRIIRCFLRFFRSGGAQKRAVNSIEVTNTILDPVSSRETFFSNNTERRTIVDVSFARRRFLFRIRG